MTRTVEQISLEGSPRARIEVQRLSFSIAEVVAATGMSRYLIKAEIERGRLVARKTGGRTIVLAADLVAFLDALPLA